MTHTPSSRQPLAADADHGAARDSTIRSFRGRSAAGCRVPSWWLPYRKRRARLVRRPPSRARGDPRARRSAPRSDRPALRSQPLGVDPRPPGGGDDPRALRRRGGAAAAALRRARRRRSAVPGTLFARFRRAGRGSARRAPRCLQLRLRNPRRRLLAAFRERGIVTIGTATTPDEAAALDQAGVDAIVASGAEAGGHRGAFLAPAEDSLVGTLSLVRVAAAEVERPVIAAGGIADALGIVAALGARRRRRAARRSVPGHRGVRRHGRASRRAAQP